MGKYQKIILTAAAFFAAATVFGEIKMSSIFADNMVLQREFAVKVWGDAAPNSTVEVRFRGQKKSATSDDKGAWSIRLDKMPADKTPREMTVSENGKVGKRIKNILVGEVWILGGQSNMAWTLEKSDGGDEAAARLKYPDIRYFNQNCRAMSKTPRKTMYDASWLELSPENAPKLSAVGVLFAEKLRADLDVPVGLVFTALGAAQMVVFIPEEKCATLEYTRGVCENFIKRNATYSYENAMKSYKRKRAQWEAEREKAKSENRPYAEKFNHPVPNRQSFLPPFCTPFYVYNAVVAPLAGFGARGVLWYQGESDSADGRLENFGEQFGLLVSSWREKFDNPDLYFLTVQLASYEVAKRDWGLTRWKQYMAAKSLPKCFAVNNVDCGEARDIHPKDKLTVATRLEKTALREVYGREDVRSRFPSLKEVRYDGGSAVASFAVDSGKLEMRGKPRGFEAKVGGEWTAANAELCGNAVKISVGNRSAKIDGVRYLWKNWARPDVCLYDTNGLPAFSFTHEK